MQTASIIVYVYAVLVGIGGFIGYRKANSLPSLIMGTLSFLVLLGAGYGLGARKVWGEPLALGLALVLLVFFSIRYVKSSPKAFMPGGLMAILSVLTLLGVALTGHQK
ncbi:MAG: TMEM14 family protein [Janthinobacterium lividum]